MRPSYLEIDLDALDFNVRQIRNYVGDNRVTVMPVIKAEAYGTHINRLNTVLEQFEIVAVALVQEAVELRKQGYKKEIFVLNQPDCSEIEDIIQNNITIGVSDISFIEKIGETKQNVNVHMEIDSGMGRTGIQIDEVELFANKIKQYKNIRTEGIYTHLSSADYDKEYTENQFKKFDYCVTKAKDILGEFKFIHAQASNGILNYPEHKYNLIRAGIILYGYPSFDTTYEKINLKPVCKLKSKITFLKEVPKDTSISYSRRFITSKKTKIATIPIGYADGIRRKMIDGGEVVINGKKAPIVGTICMDSFMVDVTNIDNVKLGDEVYIWDNDIITLEEVAEKCGTINYEIMSQFSERVPRKFISSKGKINI